MAGRPKMMAKKITELEAKAEEVFNLISDYIPERYEIHEGPLREASLLCQVWNEALGTVNDAMNAMEFLATMLRDKAGIPESAARVALNAEIAKITEQRESGQAVACCERGTNDRIRMAAEAPGDGLISPTNGEL